MNHLLYHLSTVIPCHNTEINARNYPFQEKIAMTACDT